MLVLFAMLVAGCAGSLTATTEAADAADSCTALLSAEPADWPQRLPPVLALGPAGVPPLIAALADGRNRPGAQAAVAALGAVASAAAAAAPTLERLLDERAELAGEAALALGRLAHRASIPRLRDLAADVSADPAVRAACAASLVRLGDGAAVRPLVSALVLGGTPAGADAARRLGLPDKVRWAHERYLIQTALLDAAGTDFGLDTDLPWADLEAAAERIDAFLAHAAGETGR